jgi:putative phosphoribosyl transferase
MDDTFRDRVAAGEQLATALQEYRGTSSIVLGMARGGVAVGYAVAKSLDLALEALVVRKLGAPQNPELAIGAVSETGALWLDQNLVQATGASGQYIQREVAEQVAEANRRQRAYAVGPGLEVIRGRTAIVSDDGIATGASALVAVQSARNRGASTVILAVPVASRQAVRLLQPAVDQLVVLAEPDPFYAVGLYYQHFDQVTDDEVIDYLRRAAIQEVRR